MATEHLSQLFHQPRPRRRQPKRGPRFPFGLLFLGYMAVTVAVTAPFSNAQTARPMATIVPSSSSALVNIRSGPGFGRVSAQGQLGDRGTVLDQRRGEDGYTWYFLQLESSGQRGWVREDLITFGTPETAGLPQEAIATPAQPPAIATTPQAPTRRVWRRFQLRPDTGGGAPPTSLPAPTIATNSYSQDQIDYFLEIALGSEWGNSGAVVRKWTQDLRIQVMGSPSAEDLDTLRTVVQELNTLTQGQVQLTFVQQNPNVQIYFVPESDFSRYEPNYVPRNMGFFWTHWNNGGISDARVLISTTGVTQTERSHLIREELTQSMGLMQDSYRYENSIFYQRWTQVTAYSPEDRAAIQLLYRPEVRPGMTRSQVMDQLTRLNRS